MMADEEREQREWWLVGDSGRPVKHTGYSCAPADADDLTGAAGYWWFPTYGYSVPESKLYESEGQARAEALRQARVEFARVAALVTELESSE